MRHEMHIVKMAAQVVLNAHHDARKIPLCERTKEEDALARMRVGPLVFVADPEGQRT